MHPQIRTLNPKAHTWPFCLWNQTLAIRPRKFGASDYRPSERTTTQTYSVFIRPSHRAPPPQGCSRSPDAASATVSSHHWVALRGASARGERPPPPHRRQNTMSWSLQSGSELRLRVAGSPAESDSLKSELQRFCFADSTSQRANRRQAPAPAPGGETAIARLRRLGPRRSTPPPPTPPRPRGFPCRNYISQGPRRRRHGSLGR